MPRKGRRASDILPVFDLSARFCYFIDLNNSANKNPSLAKRARELYNTARSDMVLPIQQQLSIARNAQKDSDAIRSAISFLQKVAKSERNKEIRVVNRYIEELKKNPLLINILQNANKNRDDLTHLIRDLQQFSNNPSAYDAKEYYAKLTLIINTIRSNIETLETRLRQLNDPVRRTQHAIREDFYATRLTSDLNTLFKTMSGTILRQNVDSTSQRIIRLITDFLTTHLKTNIEFLEHPYEVAAAIMIDFENYLQQVFNKLDPEKQKRLDDLNIEQIFNDYVQGESSLLQQLQEHSKNLNDVFRTIREQTGLKKVGKDSKAYQQNLDRLERNSQSKTGVRRSSINKKISAIVGDKVGPQISWKLSGSTKHGDIYELVPIILNNGLSKKVRGTAAADIITIDYGKLHVNFGLEDYFREQSQQIVSAIEKEAATIRQDRKHDLDEVINDMNEDIRTATQQINELLKEAKIPDDVFIYHESLKLYTTVETHQRGYFHGRELNILAALDQIYSTQGIENLTLVKKNILYNIAINLAEGAVGSSARDEVENYLSIFAGMLMFDDLQNMALDIAQNTILDLEQQQVGAARHVHLYQVNDFYVPGSMLLTTLCSALEQGYNRITADYGANVEINTNKAAQSIEKYLSLRDSGANLNYTHKWPELWDQYGTEAYDGTSIRIKFLASFFDFLEDIRTYMGQ